MTHKTKGIVLRSIRYGETSLVVTAFTELFGIQTYMVNGVRTSKKSGSKAVLFQPASLLDMEVYHNEQKNMNRVKECAWPFVYQSLFSDVVKNSVAMFMVELLHKMLKQPEQNSDLFYFCEDALRELDACDAAVTANFPLFFSLQLPQFFGFSISDVPQAITGAGPVYLDLQEGVFTATEPQTLHYLQPEDAGTISTLLKILHPADLGQVRLNQQKRRMLLLKLMDYYALHMPEFGIMKTLQVLHEVL